MRLPVRRGFPQDLPQDHRHVAQCLPAGKAPENALQSGDHEQQQAGLYRDGRRAVIFTRPQLAYHFDIFYLS